MSERKKRRYELYLTEFELAGLRKVARLRGMNVAEVVRSQLTALDFGSAPPSVDGDDDSDARTQFHVRLTAEQGAVADYLGREHVRQQVLLALDWREPRPIVELTHVVKIRLSKIELDRFRKVARARGVQPQQLARQQIAELGFNSRPRKQKGLPSGPAVVLSEVIELRTTLHGAAVVDALGDEAIRHKILAVTRTATT